MKRFAAAFFLLIAAVPAMADEPEAPKRPEPHARLESGSGVLANSPDRRVAFLLVQRDSLGLTAEQTAKLDGILRESEANRKQKSEVLKALAGGLEEKLGRETPDAEGAKALVDKYFAALAEVAKFNIDAYARVQATLTPEQRVLADKLRDSLRADREKRSRDFAAKAQERSKPAEEKKPAA